MERPKPTTDKIYHIYNRGVDKRNVFLDNDDYLRFIHDLFEFNDVAPALNLAYYLGKNQSKEVGLPNIKRPPRKLLVELLIFCLMPNHIHLLMRQKREGGITEFMRKIGTGYTNYFNQKYNRSGVLFQGKYKLVRLASEPHFIHLPYYIHLNPLGLKFPGWRDEEIKNYKEAMKFLENYRWSSYLDYIGKKNFPSITQREFLNEFFGGSEQYKKDTIKWLKEMDNLEEIKDLTLE
ncbi:MAG: transposase [Parcubacteria group bacterium]|nr:transposase [Parcubacteria group bacterium]